MKFSVKNLFPFFILLFAVVGCSSLATTLRDHDAKTKAMYEADEREERAESRREELATALSKLYDFDSVGRCVYMFSTSGSGSKKLTVSACLSVAHRRIKGEHILTSHRDELKKLGFEALEVHQRDGQIETFPIR
jgi:hypothetical protein